MSRLASVLVSFFLVQGVERERSMRPAAVGGNGACVAVASEKLAAARTDGARRHGVTDRLDDVDS